VQAQRAKRKVHKKRMHRKKKATEKEASTVKCEENDMEAATKVSFRAASPSFLYQIAVMM
jgi:hypothetical protein